MARREMYVAMTRAQHELHLLGSGRSHFIRELKQIDGYEIIEEQGARMVAV